MTEEKNQFDSAGKKNGYWEEYWEHSNIVKCKGNYIHGRMIDWWEFFYSSGPRVYNLKYFENGSSYCEDYWGMNEICSITFKI